MNNNINNSKEHALFDLILLNIFGRSSCCELYKQLEKEGYKDNVSLLSNYELLSDDILSLLSKDDDELLYDFPNILPYIISNRDAPIF